ncbi:hypothetical protein Mapa_016364 [Marchantia paleacea]|nr:hypothetical protein Mapa_016364 [Marchantia paleacea]
MASLSCGVLMYIMITAFWFHHCVSTTEEGVALLKLMDRWHANFPTWIAGGDPCLQWENVTCSAGHVTQLHLGNRGLSGELAPEVGELKELILLDLSENSIQGNIPMNLASCEKLRILTMSQNPWSVSFPTVIPKLFQLEELFGSAGLFGRVPREISDLTKLKILYLNNNTELQAELKDFSTLINLEELSLWQISFKSEIPEELGNLKNLQYFNCHDCALHGGLPQSFGGLLSLNRIHLRQNSLTGGIPDSWKNLQSMEYFRLDSNALLGQFPEWVFNGMPNLTSLYLSRNQFYGKPPDIAFLEEEYNVSTRFEVMRWDCNYLEGPTPCGTQNPCSNATIEKRGDNVDSSDFYFYPNCYEDASVDDISRVSNCVGHTLTCAQFAKTVIEQNGCPACPSGQVLKSGSTASNGCVCSLYSSSGSNFPVGAVVGGVLGLAFVFAVVLGLVLWKRRKHFSFMDVFARKEEAEESAEWVIPAGVQRFTVQELARITSDFSDEHVIGHGGFGNVYFGTLDDGRTVAIKRASARSVQGVREFRNEITLLSRLHHRHLVRLEGFCFEKNFQVLVYEFLKNGNLQDNLYGEKVGDCTLLNSKNRLDIAYGVAQGLEYLHSFADPPVIHRDIKPSNILLDDQLVAKVADFGISKESPEDGTHVSTRPAGTAGFLDPEYFLSRQLTTASDVYAYGVVLLELITGQMAIDHKRFDEFNLIQWVRKRYKTAGVISIIDPAIENDYSPEAYTVVAELALKCADFSKSSRPSMKEVLSVLESIMVAKSPGTPITPTDGEVDWLGRRPGHRNQYMNMDSESANHTEGSQAWEPSDSFTVNTGDLTPR